MDDPSDRRRGPMAKTEVERVQDWRAARLKAGYELTTIWLRREDKRYLEDLARARGQSLSDCLLDGLRALPAAPRTGKPLMLVDSDQLKKLIVEMGKAGQDTGDGCTSMPTVKVASTTTAKEKKRERDKAYKERKKAEKAGQGVMEALESTAPAEQAGPGLMEEVESILPTDVRDELAGL
jgi:hypothetical protein